MRIAFVLYDRAGYRAGPVVNARRLLPQLTKRGHEVVAFVFVGGHTAPNADKLSEDGVQIYKKRMPKYTETGISWLLEMVTATQPDVFVANSYVPAWFSARWVRAAGIPTIAAFRNDDEFHWAMAREFIFGERSWAVSGVVCVSEHLGALVRQRKPKYSKISVIPSGVPIPESVASRNKSEPLRIIYVGRLVQQQKRIRETLDSLIKVLQQVPDATATFIGQDYGDEKPRLAETVSKNGLTERVSFSSVVEPEDIQETLKNYNVIALLSDYEGTPGAIMDGMACGLVPVCLDIPGGTRELVVNRQTGLVVRNRNEAFVNAMVELNSDTDLMRKLSRNAHEHIKASYSLERAVTSWELFCEKLSQAEKPHRGITQPKYYELPPVRAGLANSDRRCPRLRRIFESVLPQVIR